MFRRIVRTLAFAGGSPEHVARSFAIGIFFGFCPLVGLHTVLGLAVAVPLRLNKLAVLVGVYANAPWFFLPFYGFATWLGFKLTGMEGVPLEQFTSLRLLELESWQWLLTQWRLLIPAFVGSFLLCTLLAMIAYPVSLHLIRRIRDRVGDAAEETEVVA